MAKPMPAVDTWDLSQYPDKHEGHAGSDSYRFIILNREGNVEWHECDVHDEKGNVVAKKRLDQKLFDVTGLGTSKESEVKKLKCRWGINPVDVRMAEAQIGGKPTLVQMGLWYTPTFRESDGAIIKWTPVDRRKVLRPPFRLNVTEQYYKKGGWREKAYADDADPYVESERPTTRLMEMEAELNELRAKVKK